MKKLYLTYIILFFWLLFCSFIDKDETNEKYPNDPIQVRVVYKFSQQATKENTPIIITDTMALDIGKEWSVYYDFNKSRRDSLKDVFWKNNPIKQLSLSRDIDDLQQRLETKKESVRTIDKSRDERMSIFKQRNKQSIVVFDDAPNAGPGLEYRYFKLIENIPPQNWQITGDTTTILDYNCTKAVANFRGREYIACFTMDIPIAEGPWKLYGLPGLILKVEEKNQIFTFEAIGLQEVKDEKIFFPDDREIVPCKNMQQINQYRKNESKSIGLGFMDAPGIITFINVKNPVTYYDLELEY